MDGNPIIARHEYDNGGSLIDVSYMYVTGKQYKGVVTSLSTPPVPTVSPIIGEIVATAIGIYTLPNPSQNVTLRSSNAVVEYKLIGITNTSESTLRSGETNTHNFTGDNFVTGVEVVTISGGDLFINHIDG